MKVSEKREFVGEFYLPRNPGHKIPGTLKIGLNGEVRLETFGNFEPFPKNETQRYLSLINGEVTDVGRVALIDCCYRSESVPLDGSPKKAIIDARYALCNLYVAYENREEIKFDTLHFSVEHLRKWFNFAGTNSQQRSTKHGSDMKELLDIVGTTMTGDDRTEKFTINNIPQKSIIENLDDGIKLQFVLDANLFRSVDEVKITQNAFIKITSDRPRPLSYFTDLVGKTNTFLCLAIGEIVCIKDVVVPKDGQHPTVQIYYQSFVRAEKYQERNFSGALCQFQDIEENFPAIFNDWIKNYELTRPTYSLYLSCRMERVKSLEIAFLSLVQALENLHEAGRELYGWPKNNGLEGKLKKLIFTFEDLIPRDQVDVWNEITENAVGVRNYLTHYNKPEFKEKSENLSVIDALYRNLEAMIQLHFLKQIGFSNQKIASILKRAHWLSLGTALRWPYQGK